MDNLERIYSLITTGIPNAPPLIEKQPTNSVNLSPHKKVSGDSKTIRRSLAIHVNGSHIPDLLHSTISDFLDSAPFPKAFAENAKSLGHQDLTPVQMQAIPVLMNDREVMVCAPTGSGKTLAYLLPIIGKLSLGESTGIRALILAPSRELVKQIQTECEALTRGLGFCSIVLPKLTPTSTQRFTSRMTKQGTRKRCRILVATPNRLVHLLEQGRILDLSLVEYLVLDEADKLFEATGKRCFREQLPLIFESCSSRELKRAMFSATYAHDVETWCKTANDTVVQITVGNRNSATSTVNQKLLYCGCEEGKLIGLRNVLREGHLPPILIFVDTKQRAAQLFKELLYDGLMVGAIHGDLTNGQREKIVAAFAEGKIWVLICTDLMGRGMDFKQVSLVINYDLPASAVSYIHRIGRAGRAGHRGNAITFYTDSEIPNMRSIANLVKQSGGDVPDYLLNFKKPTSQMRRKMLTRPKIRTDITRDDNLGKKRRRKRGKRGKLSKK